MQIGKATYSKEQAKNLKLVVLLGIILLCFATALLVVFVQTYTTTLKSITLGMPAVYDFCTMSMYLFLAFGFCCVITNIPEYASGVSVKQSKTLVIEMFGLTMHIACLLWCFYYTFDISEKVYVSPSVTRCVLTFIGYTIFMLIVLCITSSDSAYTKMQHDFETAKNTSKVLWVIEWTVFAVPLFPCRIKSVFLQLCKNK